MLFFEILSYLLVSLSLSFMWSFSEIFRPVRNFIARIPYIRRPLICPECSSFWVGLAASFLFNPLILVFGFLSYPICGLITHLAACFLYKKYTSF